MSRPLRCLINLHNWTTADYDPSRQVATRKCFRCGAQRERNSSGESGSWKRQERGDSGLPPTFPGA